MRTRLVFGVITTVLLAGTLGLGATQAGAAVAGSPQRATAAQAADAPAGWVHRGKYWTRGGCLEAGQEGVQRRHWDEFQCANGAVFWNLWTNR
jgi:hypothetical protein